MYEIARRKIKRKWINTQFHAQELIFTSQSFYSMPELKYGFVLFNYDCIMTVIICTEFE
jgi:hypothetical protein